MDVLAGAAGALAVGRGAMVVQLQRDANDVVPLRFEERRRDRGIDTTRHGHHHAGLLRPSLEVKTVTHRARGACRAPEALPGPLGMNLGAPRQSRMSPPARADGPAVLAGEKQFVPPSAS